MPSGLKGKAREICLIFNRLTVRGIDGMPTKGGGVNRKLSGFYRQKSDASLTTSCQFFQGFNLRQKTFTSGNHGTTRAPLR
jgi:hypothetical protein